LDFEGTVLHPTVYRWADVVVEPSQDVEVQVEDEREVRGVDDPRHDRQIVADQQAISGARLEGALAERGLFASAQHDADDRLVQRRFERRAYRVSEEPEPRQGRNVGGGALAELGSTAQRSFAALQHAGWKGHAGHTRSCSN